jgi:hypothetical protein
MKKLLTMGAIASLAIGALTADEPKVQGSATTTSTTSSASVSKAGTNGPVDRCIEFRFGPRMAWLYGDTRIGKTGTEFSIWDDLGLDEVTPGLQLDLDTQPFQLWQPYDWKPLNRLHLEFSMTWDYYDKTGNTQENISDGENTLVSGAGTSLRMDAFTFEGRVGYDAFQNNTFRIKPYIGGKGVYAKGDASFTGDVRNSSGVLIATGRSKSTEIDNGYAFVMGGIDTRGYITRQLYLGGDLGASGLDNWFTLTGEIYAGWDFNRYVGLRAGYAYDYFNRENSVKSSMQNILLSGVYLQVVGGF